MFNAVIKMTKCKFNIFHTRYSVNHYIKFSPRQNFGKTILFPLVANQQFRTIQIYPVASVCPTCNTCYLVPEVYATSRDTTSDFTGCTED